MGAIRFGGECPASIVAKKRQLRKRAGEVDVQINFFTTGSTKKHTVRAHRVKTDSPRVSLFLVSLFLCAPCGEKV
jgi:hypothetical protein